MGVRPRESAWFTSARRSRIKARAAGFWFAPGGAFDPDHGTGPWVRFNVGYRSPALNAWLEAACR